MSIRLRLLVMCVVVAILPAVPLTLLVQNLLEKSFNVGLSTTVSHALESGMIVARKHMIQLQSQFEEQAAEVVSLIPTFPPKSAQVVAALARGHRPNEIDGYFLDFLDADPGLVPPAGILPEALRAFASHPGFKSVVASAGVSGRPPHLPARDGLSFFETTDKALQLALWKPPAGKGGGLVLYRRLDREFLSQARQLLNAGQIFAQLRLSQGTLSRSFFYPFLIVYGIVLAIALALALLMAERMAAPVRRLAAAAVAVAGGDRRICLEREIGGEIGRLIEAFNLMVSRLDLQQRKLLDMEKIAAWREMARHLAHEIKNPLLPIRLAVSEMRDQYRGDDGAYRQFIDESARVVEDELEHLQRLVREFSTFAKMPGLSPTPGSLGRLISDVARLYPQVESRIDVDCALPEFPFDPDQIRRVLVNLFDNSVSVSPDGAEVAVTINLGRRGDDAVLVFRDNGPGIAAEHIPRVFDPYFSTRRTGTGLGLALTKSIVVMHEGTIGAESPAGGGAVFTMTLPLRGPGASHSPTLTQ